MMFIIYSGWLVWLDDAFAGILPQMMLSRKIVFSFIWLELDVPS